MNSDSPNTADIVELAARCEQKAFGSLKAALNSPLSGSRRNENREVGFEWLKIAAALHALKDHRKAQAHG